MLEESVRKTGLIIWILQTGEPLHCDKEKVRAMRAMNLADTLVARGHTVVLWSSAFYHQEKRHRCPEFSSLRMGEKLTINLVPSPGYAKNIGLGRLYDHFLMARNLYRILASGEFAVPDVAFVGYPPIETAAVMLRWLNRRKVPSFLDVKDQWPVLFVDAFPRPLRLVARLAFAPYYWIARYAMRKASAFSSMTSSFLSWAANFSGRKIQSQDAVVPLTPPVLSISAAEKNSARQWWQSCGVDLKTSKRFGFVGSLSRAFDFSPVYETAVKFHSDHIDCQFVICGDGDEAASIKAMFSGLPNVVFPGWVDVPKMMTLMEASLAMLAPYKNTCDFVQSIPNKIIDSFAHGLPVITGLRGEVQSLVERSGAGFFCEEKSSWHVACMNLLNDPDGHAEMSINAKRLYHDRFGFESVYSDLADRLENLAAMHDR